MGGGMKNVVYTSERVDVVRCKDCKYRIVNENAGKEGFMALDAMCALDTDDPYELGRNAEDPDWFCADGDRRDENGENA